MANDKDFIVKNAVEVGKDTKVTLGTITSSDIDLSTGNYFSDTLAANTTYTISNAGDVQSFQLEINGGSDATEYDLANGAYDTGQSLSFSSVETSPSMAALSSDGTKIYVAGTSQTGCIIHQYNLDTAYDLTSHNGNASKDVSAQDSNPDALAFSPDGLTMWIAAGAVIYQYDLGTAWTVNTAVYNNDSWSTGHGNIKSLVVRDNGTSFYILSETARRVYEYTLGTANDISGTRTQEGSFNVNADTTAYPYAMAISHDGSKLFLSRLNLGIKQYNMTTNWQIDTASTANISFTGGSQAWVNTEGFDFNSDGTKLFVTDPSTDSFLRYSTSAAINYSIFWPTSIEWAGGAAPSGPDSGETDIFTISTDDGGTTYHGFKTADNLS
jgi:hypothetical protein